MLGTTLNPDTSAPLSQLATLIAELRLTEDLLEQLHEGERKYLALSTHLAESIAYIHEFNDRVKQTDAKPHPC